MKAYMGGKGNYATALNGEYVHHDVDSKVYEFHSSAQPKIKAVHMPDKKVLLDSESIWFREQPTWNVIDKSEAGVSGDTYRGMSFSEDGTVIEAIFSNEGSVNTNNQSNGYMKKVRYELSEPFDPETANYVSTETINTPSPTITSDTWPEDFQGDSNWEIRGEHTFLKSINFVGNGLQLQGIYRKHAELWDVSGSDDVLNDQGVFEQGIWDGSTTTVQIKPSLSDQPGESLGVPLHVFFATDGSRMFSFRENWFDSWPDSGSNAIDVYSTSNFNFTLDLADHLYTFSDTGKIRRPSTFLQSGSRVVGNDVADEAFNLSTAYDLTTWSQPLLLTPAMHFVIPPTRENTL